ncbi:hypothetical protein BU26DRAFT_602374 [Trematosphaeria pertusa]|uniref:F-box domain-containing protein n=1 Tax=Trematosphaeria pertusa TaxID=390896 RepID=A0A6A6IN51_9PLEO|nr:uncharacterized protein BU26DRAFT_602374 [Trematosphaeria pertusa]KAF2251881.1 hypothetical protein BU26DRAFT_602374 [Trematosphaeria pertusa]
MGTARRPIILSDDPDPNHVSLPSYIRRHVNLGFNSNDVAALISAIDSSQKPQLPTLPHLPAEILLHILEHVPIDHILTWRLVCRGFRDAIDGPVMYECLKRAELIGYLGPRAGHPLDLVMEADYERIKLVRASFERLEDCTTTEGIAVQGRAKWSATHAIFQLEDEWWESFSLIRAKYDRNGSWKHLLEALELLSEEDSYGTLRWCMRLDKAVLDLELPVEALKGYLQVDLQNKKVLVEWKDLLFRFIKTETLLRTMMEEKRDSAFTFSYEEDCLRALRRHCLRAALDLNDRSDRQINWAMNLLCPLFGQQRYDHADSLFGGLEYAEDDAIAVLTVLRKEAAMSPRQIAQLRQLAHHRIAMEEELGNTDKLFGDFTSAVFGISPALCILFHQLPKVPCNPLAWSDEVTVREAERIRIWQTQKKTRQQLAVLMKGTVEALSLPDDAFDDLESDF